MTLLEPAECAEVDEATWELRRRHVQDVFDAIEFRPGTKIALDGISVTVTETVPDVTTGTPTQMCWDDEDQGERLFAAIADPTVPTDALRGQALRAALCAVVNNDLHELCEFFTLDGNQVYDPHPNGGRYEPLPFDVEVVTPGHPPAPARRSELRHVEVLEIPPARARTVASELCERVQIGGPTNGRYEVHGDHLTHHGTYPDRDTGEPREWLWSREWLGEYLVVDAGNPAAALRAGIVTDMFTLAAQSATHEIAEWFRCDGTRVWDPHPPLFEGATHLAQRDLVEVRITHRSTPWGPRHPREGAAG